MGYMLIFMVLVTLGLWVAQALGSFIVNMALLWLCLWATGSLD